MTAAAIDISAKLAAALPLFIGIIVILAMLLLLIAFRSIIVPIKAVAGFLLSIGASMGLTGPRLPGRPPHWTLPGRRGGTYRQLYPHPAYRHPLRTGDGL